MKKSRLVVAAAGAVLAAVVAVSGCAKKKDPKEVVIEAFEGVYTDDQVVPMEEIFGFKEMGEAMLNSNSEYGLTLKMDSCTNPQINTFAGSGLRLETKTDLTNKKSSADLVAIYNGMDLATMNMYSGDDMLLIKIPELSNKVFALDVSEGFIDRVKQSPLVGPILVQAGMDLDGLSAYMEELTAEVDQEGGTSGTFDIEALWKRYQEGSQAQDNFKAALTVEKADGKETFTVDGKETECEIYQVLVSKDSMIEFLRTSSDFFLQDEELKQAYVKQLEMTVRMSEILGGSTSGLMGPDVTYEDIEEAVDKIIKYLDESLADINMTVYVTKNGRLAAIDGTTSVTDNERAKTIDIAFHTELQGGAFPTHNAIGSIALSEADKDMGTLSFTRGGIYDKEQWSTDLSISAESAAAGGTYTFTYAGSYQLAERDFQITMDLSGAGSQLASLTASGMVDSLEKGKSIHITLDSLNASMLNNAAGITFSGEYSYQPLTGEVTSLEGTQFDILAATENDWMSVYFEALNGITTMAEQLGIDL